jgi:hypothetical protein
MRKEEGVGRKEQGERRKEEGERRKELRTSTFWDSDSLFSIAGLHNTEI